MPNAVSAGIVIPGYGHPKFLAEAIQSACSQECSFDYKVVVVDDGCRFEETASVVNNLMDVYPGKLHYLRHPNTRLPGARNAGVRFLLTLVPEIEVIYFLDADNRVEPYSLQAFRNVLDSDPSLGWAYPDITFFGQVWNAEGFETRETAPRYSRLLHLIGNISEAGSMVRADAFRQGVFFDESMRHGFEDWEFWLSMLEADYIGAPVHEAGFSYRRRPESMLAGSRRLEESLIAYIKQKHAPLYTPRHLMALEHQEAPAFAVVRTDTKKVCLFSDPLLPCQSLSLSDFLSKTRAWLGAPRQHFFPGKLLFLKDKQWNELERHAQWLRWFFWQLRGNAPLFHSISFGADDAMKMEGRPWGTPTLQDRLLCLSSKMLRNIVDGQAGITGISDLPAAQKLHVETPQQLITETSSEDSDELFEAVAGFCRALDISKNKVRHLHRRYAGPDHAKIRTDLIEPTCAYEEQVPASVAHAKPRIIIAVDAALMNGEESRQGLSRLVNEARGAGAEIAFVQEFVGSFDDSWRRSVPWQAEITDVFPLQQRGNQEEFRMYLGRRISANLPMSSEADVSTIGRMADTFVCIGGRGSLEVLGEIRGFGVKTAVWLEPEFENGIEGESFAKMLAYEHAIDFLVSDNTAVRRRLSAQGVPPGKIIDSSQFLSSPLVKIKNEPVAS